TGTIVTADNINRLWVYINNIAPHNTYGVFGNGLGVGNPALDTDFPGAVFAANVIQGSNVSQYYTHYPGNFFPATMNDVGFVNYAAGDYHLSAFSPYKNAGTDGKDIGADIDALNAAQANTDSPPTADTTPPIESMTAPTSGVTVSGTVTVSANATDNV